MGSRASLNKVLLIGNLTRDPELRYTPSGAAVCTFSIATNRFYVASDGAKKEEAEFIKIVAWNKLGELCSQLLAKGRKVYVEGRMQTRSWETPDGQNRQTTEVVIDDMRILDSKRDYEAAVDDDVVLSDEGAVKVAKTAASEPETEKQPSFASADAGDLEVKKASDGKKSKGSKVEKMTKAEKVEDSKDDKEEDKGVDLEDLPF